MRAIFALFFFTFSAQAFDWQGHRGARGLYPENTISGMMVAMKYPVTTLELDVVVSKDLQVVVSHEPWMSEEICLDPKGKEVKDREVNLFKLTYQEIKKYDCGTKVHPRFPEQVRSQESKPLLTDLIDAVEKETEGLENKKIYSIEIKSSEEAEKAGLQPDFKTMTDLVLKVVLGRLPRSRFMIQSFDWRVLRHIHMTRPYVNIVALRETPYSASKIIKELGFTPRVFSPEWTMLSKKQVNYFHRRKVLVIPWTVNKLDVMKNMISMGVDGIITDYPNLIQELCGSGENLFEGKCVKVPRHAVPWDQNPGWVCESGYVQRWMHCEKLKIPEHAFLLEDGKNWACKDGYVKYRATCKKK